MHFRSGVCHLSPLLRKILKWITKLSKLHSLYYESECLIAGSVMGWSTPALTHPVTQQWVSKPNIWAKSPPSHFVGQYHNSQSPSVFSSKDLILLQKFKLLKLKSHSS